MRRVPGLWILAAGFAACAFDGDAADPRRITQVDVNTLTPLWTISGSDDTTLLDPFVMLLDSGRVFLSEPDGPYISALDATSGALLWKYGQKGDGPGEFRRPMYLAWHPDGVLVGDSRSFRLVLVSRDGQFVVETSSPHGLSMASICALRNGTTLSNVVSMGPDVPLYTKRFGESESPPTTGAMSRFRDMEGVVDLTSLGVAGLDGCLASRKVFDGLAIVGPDGDSILTPYIEHVTQRPLKPPEQIRDTSDIPIPFSLRSGVAGDKAYVIFGGQTCASRCIDFYDLPSLAYSHSIQFVNMRGYLSDVAFDGDKMLVLRLLNSTPTLAAYRLDELGIP